jgi:hypothetical protein
MNRVANGKTAPQVLANVKLPEGYNLKSVDALYKWQTIVYDFGDEYWMPPKIIQDKANETFRIRQSGVHDMPKKLTAKNQPTKCPDIDSKCLVIDM